MESGDKAEHMGESDKENKKSDNLTASSIQIHSKMMAWMQRWWRGKRMKRSNPNKSPSL